MSTATSTSESPPPGATRAGQLRRAAVVLVTAGVLLGICDPYGPVAIYFVPLITGGGLVLAALVGGPGSRLMGPGLPVMFWGIGIVLTQSFKFTGAFALPTFMIGLGAIAAYLMTYAGWHSNAFPVGVGIAFIGVGQLIHGLFGGWVAYAFIMLLGLIALAELADVRSSRRPTDTSGFAREEIRQPEPAQAQGAQPRDGRVRA